jgi:uncharacterized surface protein with fasciclin (FAS1) repeats
MRISIGSAMLVAVLSGVLAATAGTSYAVSYAVRATDAGIRMVSTGYPEGSSDYCPEQYVETDDCEGLSVRELKADLKAHGKTLAVVISDYAHLSRFMSMIEASGLANEIDREGPFTIFAPKNSAFSGAKGLSTNTVLETATKAQLREAVAGHIVVGEVTWQRLAGRRTVLTTLAGGRIMIDGTSGISAGNARVTASDVFAANGVLHIVNAVILPDRSAKSGV